MASDRVSEQSIDYPTTDRVLARTWRKIVANRYSIYSTAILMTVVGVAFLFRGFV